MSKKQRSHEEHEEHADETWLIPYSDLLTLLLALFIVLFASSQVDAKKFSEMSREFNVIFNGGSGLMENPSPVATTDGEVTKLKNNTKSTKANVEDKPSYAKETEQLTNLKKKLDQYIKENHLSDQLSTKLNYEQLMVSISDNTLFPSGSAVVKPESRKLAGFIANMLYKYPQFEIIVSGHTDNNPINTPEFQSNWDLSSERALNFMKILLQNKKLDPARFSAVGFGEYRPIASNDSNEGRAKNRRVEVSVIRNFSKPAADDAAAAK